MLEVLHCRHVCNVSLNVRRIQYVSIVFIYVCDILHI